MNKQPFETPIVETDDADTLSQKLFEANMKLLAYEKERHDFLSNVFHDLRAPLTAIRSGVDLLLAGPGSEVSYDDIFRLLDRRCTTLETLINDIYFMCIIENKDIPFSFENTDCATFLEEFFYEAELNSIYKDKQLLLLVPENLRCKINIDIQKTLRVLDNLFVNAAKYSDEGAIISLNAYVDEGSNRLCIEVSDTGYGISEQDLPNIFIRSYMCETARTPDNKNSSGLGLCIAKTIVERQNGQIEVSSTLGVGTSFKIFFPTVQ